MEKKTINLPAKITWLPAKTFELEFTIPWTEVKKSYDEALKHVTSQAEIKGFRKGKAPQEMVEKNIDRAKLYGRVLEELLPQTYFAAVRHHNLRPVCDPKITPVKTEENNDWIFKATSCETPAVQLGDYENKIKSTSAKEKIWLPGKDQKPDTKKDEDEDKKLKGIFETLLKEAKLELSPILIEEEEKRLLSRLIEQINKMGITLDEYAKSTGKSTENLKAEYRRMAEETLKLEFILSELAVQKKIAVEQKEIDDLIAAVPDEHSRQHLKSPEQQAYVTSILKKRKVIDILKKL